MLTEKQVAKLFHKYKREIFKLVGHKRALFGSEIQTLALLNLFNKGFLGVFTQDKAKLHKKGFMVVNTDISTGKGIHWVALYITKCCVYVYDSFGRPTEKLLKHLVKKAKALNLRIVDSDPDPEQFGNSQICGVLALAWLCVVQSHGIRSALKI